MFREEIKTAGLRWWTDDPLGWGLGKKIAQLSRRDLDASVYTIYQIRHDAYINRFSYICTSEVIRQAMQRRFFAAGIKIRKGEKNYYNIPRELANEPYKNTFAFDNASRGINYAAGGDGKHRIILPSVALYRGREWAEKSFSLL